MERRTCKLCFRTFSNGRALGGHMRSHMATLQPSPPPKLPPTPPKIQLVHHHHRFSASDHHHETIESAFSSSCSSDQDVDIDIDDDDDKALCYGLRENPKKSFRLADPEFSFAVDAGSVVQDRESETESNIKNNNNNMNSNKNTTFRRRSKRNRKSGFTEQNQQQPELKKSKSSKPIKAELVIEPEPVSSVSDTTPEEDVALCLMMLSRATWNTNNNVEEEDEHQVDDDQEDEEDEDEEKSKSIEESDDDDDDSTEELKIVPSRGNRAKYQCGTCKKVFRSYQALGGHRASHKKIRGCSSSSSPSLAVARIKPATHETDQSGGNAATPTSKNPVIVDRKIHECPVCFRVFGSGQALGGHKRSHVSGSAATTTTNVISNRTTTTTTTTTTTSSNSTKFVDNLIIDLNLPAPIEEEDDYSQIELSAVSDAEFS